MKIFGIGWQRKINKKEIGWWRKKERRRRRKKRVCVIFRLWMIDGRNTKHIPNFSLPLAGYLVNYRRLQIFVFKRDDQRCKYQLKLEPPANIGGLSRAFRNRVILSLGHRNLLFLLPLPVCFQDKTITLMYVSIIWFWIYLSNENV